METYSLSRPKKVTDESKTKTLVTNQRPNVIDKKIRLPVEIKEGEEKIESAKYENGILTLMIPIIKKGKNISIE